jgi:hypothetical protein
VRAVPSRNCTTKAHWGESGASWQGVVIAQPP